MIFFRRCTARRERRATSIFWGRCDLDKNHEGDHELERGFFSCTWSTDWTRP